MYLIYADDIGQVMISIDTEYGISFFGGIAYFTDENGNDFQIDTKSIIEIGKE